MLWALRCYIVSVCSAFSTFPFRSYAPYFALLRGTACCLHGIWDGCGLHYNRLCWRLHENILCLNGGRDGCGTQTTYSPLCLKLCQRLTCNSLPSLSCLLFSDILSSFPCNSPLYFHYAAGWTFLCRRHLPYHIPNSWFPCCLPHKSGKNFSTSPISLSISLTCCGLAFPPAGASQQPSTICRRHCRLYIAYNLSSPPNYLLYPPHLAALVPS